MPVKQATAVLNAPADDAGRVQKMMSARPTLNANQRRSKVRSAPRDISGASPDGTFVGRGGNKQQFGKAAMARMPPPASPPPDANALQAQMRELQGGVPAAEPGGTMGFPAPSDMALQAAQAGGEAPGMPPPQFADKVGRMPPGLYPQGLEGPGMGGQMGAPDPNDPRMRQFLETMGRGGGGAEAQPFGRGIPPQIMQRLQALNGGGMQGAAPGPGGAMGAPQQRSFQDFWQGGGGMGRGVAY